MLIAGFQPIAKHDTSLSLAPTQSRHASIARLGKYFEYLRRSSRSSAQPNSSLPSTTIAAELVTPVLWMPMTIMIGRRSTGYEAPFATRCAMIKKPPSEGGSASNKIRMDAILIRIEGVPQDFVQRVELATRWALEQINLSQAILAPLRVPDLAERVLVDVAHREPGALEVATHLNIAVLIEIGRERSRLAFLVVAGVVGLVFDDLEELRILGIDLELRCRQRLGLAHQRKHDSVVDLVVGVRGIEHILVGRLDGHVVDAEIAIEPGGVWKLRVVPLIGDELHADDRPLAAVAQRQQTLEIADDKVEVVGPVRLPVHLRRRRVDTATDEEAVLRQCLDDFPLTGAEIGEDPDVESKRTQA